LKKLFIYLSIIGITTIFILVFYYNPIASFALILLELIGLIFIYVLILFLIKIRITKMINKKNSIIIFQNILHKSLRKCKIKSTKEIAFNRYVKMNKKKIPLGKIIVDSKNSLIFFYETFCIVDENIISLPDIRFFSFNQLMDCQIMYDDSFITLNDYCNMKSVIKKKKEYLELKLIIKNFSYSPLIIKYNSINNFDKFYNIYNTLNNIIKNKTL